MKILSSLMLVLLLNNTEIILSQENRKSNDTIHLNEKKIQVNGLVVDARNKPLKGVTIYVDSVKTRVKSNRKGEFNLVLSLNNKLVSTFSNFSGLLNIAYEGETELKFVVPNDFKVMSEMELSDLGYNIKTPKKPKKAPKDYSKYLTVYQLLVAEFPGVLVTGKTIRLRGTAGNSVNGGQEPLIIINGTQANSVDNIIPQEIKSVQLVRDEGASFYGVRGANGVIVIKMKNSG